MVADNKDVVSPLIYVTGNTPNVMTIAEDGSTYRQTYYPLGSLFPVDIVMGARLQTPRVYRKVRYSFHQQGDSVGWGLNCQKYGIKPWCDSRIEVLHYWKTDKCWEKNVS